MSVRPTADEVAEHSLFAALTREEHEELAALSRIETHARGAILFEEGDPPGDLYVVLGGRVALSMRGPRDETSILTLRTGELLGFSALLSRPRLATARVVADCRLLRMETSGLLTLCETDHHVGYALMRQAFEEIADRLTDTRRQMLDVFGAPCAG